MNGQRPLLERHGTPLKFLGAAQPMAEIALHFCKRECMRLPHSGLEGGRIRTRTACVHTKVVASTMSTTAAQGPVPAAASTAPRLRMSTATSRKAPNSETCGRKTRIFLCCHLGVSFHHSSLPLTEATRGKSQCKPLTAGLLMMN